MKLKDDTKESFGKYIRKKREEAGLGIREIERITKGLIKAPYLSRIENGKEKPPGPGILTKLADLLKIDRDDIFSRAGKIPPELHEAYINEENVRYGYRTVKESGGKMSEPLAPYGVSNLPVDRSLILEKELHRWVRILKENYHPEQIILFGSYAENRITSGSDIDLVIIKKTNKPFLERTKEVLLLIQPKVGVDILVYTPIEFKKLKMNRPFFRDEIVLKGEVIFERGK
tara:strand:+ start:19417 stop:20106 length:690 start_codon:yes stop_codon:yes gene_type:complete